MTCHFFTILLVHNSRETRASTPTCRRLVRGERDTGCPQKDLMDMLARELKEELEARDQPKTGNKRHGCAGGCTRRDRARACRILQSHRMDTFTVLSHGSKFYHFNCSLVPVTLLPF